MSKINDNDWLLSNKIRFAYLINLVEQFYRKTVGDLNVAFKIFGIIYENYIKQLW